MRLNGSMLPTADPQSTTNRSFYFAGGTLRHDALSYVERQADLDLYEELRRGEFCYILTSRQMGKSSLMVRTAVRLRQEGVHVAVLDLTAVGQNLTTDQWYDGLLGRLGRELDVEDELEEYWLEHGRLGPLQRWMAALQDVVLGHCTGRVVIFVDEIDAVRSLPFPADEFFAGIRECYTRRAYDPEYNRLTFCLMGVASPTDLIQDTRTTPFNIGRRIELNDFSDAEAAPLAEGLGRDEQNGRSLLERILYWTGGHPYLTQRLCQSVAGEASVTGPADVDRQCEALFLSSSARERDDNLLFVRERLLKSEADLASLLDLYAKVRRGRRVRNDDTNHLISILRLSGVTRVNGGCLSLRNRIYARVFDREWVTQHMPDAELRRQRTAYQRGLLRAAAVAGVVVAIVEQQRKAAEEQREKNRYRLVRLNVDKGVGLVESGDLCSALPYLAEAFRLDREKSLPEQVHRARLAVMLRHCPKLVQLWFHKGEVPYAEFSRDGRRVVTASSDGTAQVWDAITGNPFGKPHKVAVSAASYPYLRDRVASFSPDGRWVVSISEEKAAQVWNVATGAPVGRSFQHAGAVRVARFSPDGARILTASDDGTARAWNVVTGEPGPPMRQEGRWGIRAAFSPDGQRVLVNSSDLTQLFDAATAEEILSTVTGRAFTTPFSPDGRRFATAARGEAGSWAVQVWDAKTGEPVHPQPLRHGNGINNAAFSPDGRRIVTASADGTARVWDATTGQPVTPSLKHSGIVLSAAFSPDARWVATAGQDQTARIWDAVTGEPVSPPLSHSGTVVLVAFAGDGRRIVTASRDGTARVWDLATDESVAPPLQEQEVAAVAQGVLSCARQLAFSSDGKRVAAANQDGRCGVWCVATGEPVTPELPQPQAHSVVFSPDNTRLLTFGFGDGGGRVWDVGALARSGGPGKLVTTLPCKVSESAGWGGQLIASFSPDGRRMLTVGDDLAHVWDAATGALIGPPVQHLPHIVGAAWSPDGSRIVTVGRDGTVRTWNVTTSKVETRPRRLGGTVSYAVFSPDGGRLLTINGDDERAAQVWETATGKPVTPLLQHSSGLRDLSFSPNGRRVLTAGTDSTARVWEATTGKQLLLLQHNGIVWRASFSADGRYIVTASTDRTARVWDAVTGEPVTPPLRHRGGVVSAAVSPDARYAVSGSEGERAMVRRWRISPDDRDARHLLLLTELLSSRRINATAGAVPLDTNALRAAWQMLRAKYPADFSVSREQALQWHRRQAEECERQKQWTASVFHYDQLLAVLPHDEMLRQRRSGAVASAEERRE